MSKLFYHRHKFITDKNVSINFFRDISIFGKIAFRLWNPVEEREVPNAILTIDGHQMDYKEGFYSLEIPLESQKTNYGIISSIPLDNATIYLPCSPNDVVLTN